MAESLNENINDEYRKSVRNKILKRIYDKNILDPIDPIDYGSKKLFDPRNNDTNIQIEQKIRNRLSNECYQKTLERVLNNYNDGYWHQRLEISRKESLNFFINNNWPIEYDQYSHDNDSKAKNRKNKRRNNPNRSAKSLDYYAKKPDSNNLNRNSFVFRQSSTPWSLVCDKKSKINKIIDLIEDRFNDTEIVQIKDEFLGKFPSHRTLIRLIHEQINVNQFFKHEIKGNIQERYVYYEPNNESSIGLLNRQPNQSKFYRFIEKSLIFLLNSTTENIHNTDPCLNNNSFMLTIGQMKLDIQKHPAMNSLDKSLKKLLVAFDGYKQSNQCDQILEILNRQIDSILNSMKNDQKTNQNMDEIEMNKQLLTRLITKYDQTISKRRHSLINLIQQWSQFNQNDLNDDELNEIDLKLDEIEINDQENEAKELKEIVAKRKQIQQIIMDDDEQKFDMKNVYLQDGRLPGEPKFRLIELILPDNFSRPSIHSSNYSYFIEVIVRNKILATFEAHQLNYRTFRTEWAQCFRSFILPICLNSEYLLSRSVDEDNFIQNELPKLKIYEKNLSTKAISMIGEIFLKSLPSIRMNSKEQSLKIEESFSSSIENGNKKSKIMGKIEFIMFWASLPDTKTIDHELFNIYDQEKRQIKRLTDLEKIKQWIHDIHCQVDLKDWTNGLNDSLDMNEHDYHRQLELMQILIQQKYQIEIQSMYEDRGRQQQHQQRKSISNQINLTNDDNHGNFCSWEQIENNKRFQMMIQRRQGRMDHRNYHFLPLTDTDLLLISAKDDSASDRMEKSSTNKLIDFIRQSSQRQMMRICHQLDDDGQGDDDPKNVTINDWCETIDDRMKYSKVAANILTRIWEQNLALNQKNEFDGSESISTVDEIIREPKMDRISGMDFSWFSWLFQAPSTQNRKLNPARRNRHKDALNISEAIDEEIQIHLLIQHATNVPVKLDKSADDHDSISYVEVKIDHSQTQQTMSTSFSNGSKPNWNESFKFKTRLIPSNYLNLNLFSLEKHSINDSSKFDLSNQDDTPQQAKYWLGQLKIPLYALMFITKLEGSLRLFSPYFIPKFKGVRRSNNFFSLNPNRQRPTIDEEADDDDDDSDDSDGRLSRNVDKIMSHHRESMKIISSKGSLPDISLSLFITMDPRIEWNWSAKINSKSFESTKLLDYSKQWLHSLHQRFPRRRFLCLVDNIEHRSLLAIRYLSPLKPPKFIQLSPIQIESKNDRKKSKLLKLMHKDGLYIVSIIRFVSLIPSLMDMNLSSSSTMNQRKFFDQWSRTNVWMDSQQFLTIRIGCQAEHAILLACFLQYLNKQAYLAVGTSLLDGPTVFVIVYPESINNKDDDDNLKDKLIILIDAKRGQQFLPQDYDCTLISIDTIITADNIYANIQKHSHPNSISYNLQRANHWQPFFNHKGHQSSLIDNYKLTIQPQSIDYGRVNNDQWPKKLEIKIETYLREQFMTWRRHQTGSYTQFNRFGVQIIKQLLPDLEQHMILVNDGNRSHSNRLLELEENVRKHLEHIFDIHKMISYPLNVVGHAAIDFDQLSRLIFTTNLHQTHFGHSNQVEYVIACYVHPCVCNFYSLWIFLAALTTKSIIST